MLQAAIYAVVIFGFATVFFSLLWLLDRYVRPENLLLVFSVVVVVFWVALVMLTKGA